MPICFKGENLASEVPKGKASDSMECFSVAFKDRDCTFAIPFMTGKTAEQHDEMKLLQEVQRLNQEASRKAEIVAEKRHNEIVDIAREANRIAMDAKETAVLALSEARKTPKLAVWAMAVAIIAAISGPLVSYWLSSGITKDDLISREELIETIDQPIQQRFPAKEPVQDSALPSPAPLPSDTPPLSSEP